MDSRDWWGRCCTSTPGLLSWAESQAAGKWLPAFPDGSGVTQIISSNDVKKKNFFVQSCCNFHAKPVLQMARFLPSLALQGTCLRVGLCGWNRGRGDLCTASRLAGMSSSQSRCQRSCSCEFRPRTHHQACYQMQVWSWGSEPPQNGGCKFSKFHTRHRRLELLE